MILLGFFIEVTVLCAKGGKYWLGRCVGHSRLRKGRHLSCVVKGEVDTACSGHLCGVVPRELSHGTVSLQAKCGVLQHIRKNAHCKPRVGINLWSDT